ncbi:unnamed protein product, partial [Strongylus vulgaris]
MRTLPANPSGTEVGGGIVCDDEGSLFTIQPGGGGGGGGCSGGGGRGGAGRGGEDELESSGLDDER